MEPLLEAQDIRRTYTIGKTSLDVLQGVSLGEGHVDRGQKLFQKLSGTRLILLCQKT